MIIRGIFSFSILILLAVFVPGCEGSVGHRISNNPGKSDQNDPEGEQKDEKEDLPASSKPLYVLMIDAFGVDQTIFLQREALLFHGSHIYDTDVPLEWFQKPDLTFDMIRDKIKEVKNQGYRLELFWSSHGSPIGEYLLTDNGEFHYANSLDVIDLLDAEDRCYIETCFAGILAAQHNDFNTSCLFVATATSYNFMDFWEPWRFFPEITEDMASTDFYDNVLMSKRRAKSAGRVSTIQEEYQDYTAWSERKLIAFAIGFFATGCDDITNTCDDWTRWTEAMSVIRPTVDTVYTNNTYQTDSARLEAIKAELAHHPDIATSFSIEDVMSRRDTIFAHAVAGSIHHQAKEPVPLGSQGEDVPSYPLLITPQRENYCQKLKTRGFDCNKQDEVEAYRDSLGIEGI